MTSAGALGARRGRYGLCAPCEGPKPQSSVQPRALGRFASLQPLLQRSSSLATRSNNRAGLEGYQGSSYHQRVCRTTNSWQTAGRAAPSGNLSSRNPRTFSLGCHHERTLATSFHQFVSPFKVPAPRRETQNGGVGRVSPLQNPVRPIAERRFWSSLAHCASLYRGRDHETPGRGVCLQDSKKDAVLAKENTGFNSPALLETRPVCDSGSTRPHPRYPDPKGWTLSPHLIPAPNADDSLSSDGKTLGGEGG